MPANGRPESTPSSPPSRLSRVSSDGASSRRSPAPRSVAAWRNHAGGDQHGVDRSLAARNRPTPVAEHHSRCLAHGARVMDTAPRKARDRAHVSRASVHRWRATVNEPAPARSGADVPRFSCVCSEARRGPLSATELMRRTALLWGATFARASMAHQPRLPDSETVIDATFMLHLVLLSDFLSP